MKKLIALMLCLLMVVGLVACGSEETTETTTTPVDTSNLPYAGMELNVWTSYVEGTPTYEVVNEYIKKFEEKTGAKINVSHYGTDLGTILPTALEAGEEVDVFPLGSTIQLNANYEYTMDLTDYIMGTDYLDRGYPIHMNYIQKVSIDNGDGEQYHAVPTVSSYSSFWYNKAAFEDAGIEGISATPTFEEFEEVCQKLVDAGYSPIALDGAYGMGTFGILLGRLVGEEAVRDMIVNGGFSENERFIAACQKAIDWVNAGFLDPNAPAEWPASQNKIGLTGDVVMVHTGMWASGEIEEMTGASLEWGNFLFPIDPDFAEGTKGASVSCTCNCINANIDPAKADLAWEYIYYMTTGEADKAITDADVYLVNDRTMEPLPRFVDSKVIMENVTENIDYSGGLIANADVKTSVSDLANSVWAGEYATGEEVAAAFDALVS